MCWPATRIFIWKIFSLRPARKQNGAKPLPGWIIGTAGAVRYPLPDGAPQSAKTDVYGYLLATVSGDGTIQFTFEELHESDVPKYVQQRYPATLIPWCFAHNSQNIDPHAVGSYAALCARTGEDSTISRSSSFEKLMGDHWPLAFSTARSRAWALFIDS